MAAETSGRMVLIIDNDDDMALALTRILISRS